MTDTRLCGFDGIEPTINLTGTHRWSYWYFKSYEFATDRGFDLNAYRCSSYVFMSLPMKLSDDYVNVTSHSPQAQQFQKEQAREFVKRGFESLESTGKLT